MPDGRVAENQTKRLWQKGIMRWSKSVSYILYLMSCLSYFLSPREGHLYLDLQGATLTGTYDNSSDSLFREKQNKKNNQNPPPQRNSCLHMSTCGCTTFCTFKLLKELCWRHFAEEESNMLDWRQLPLGWNKRPFIESFK